MDTWSSIRNIIGNRSALDIMKHITLGFKIFSLLYVGIMTPYLILSDLRYGVDIIAVGILIYFISDKIKVVIIKRSF